MTANRLPGAGGTLDQQLQLISEGGHCHRDHQHHDCGQRDQDKRNASWSRDASAFQINDERIQHHRQQNHDSEKQQHRHEGAEQEPASEQQHDQDEKPAPIPVSEGTEFVVFLRQG